MAIYVNNKTLLQEIQKSKMTFCAYFEEWHTNQIVYTTDLSTLTDEDIEEARLHYNGKRSTEEPIEKGKEVIRLCNTYDYIPESFRQGQPEASKLRFKPFKHYIKENGEYKEVLRSFWKLNPDAKTLEDGSFNYQFGHLTDKTCLLFQQMITNYSKKGNFRRYTYLEDMKSQATLQMTLSCLKFDESASENPFAYWTTCITKAFCVILNYEKKHRDGKDYLNSMNGGPVSDGYNERNNGLYDAEAAAERFKYKRRKRTDVDESITY